MKQNLLHASLLFSDEAKDLADVHTSCACAEEARGNQPRPAGSPPPWWPWSLPTLYRAPADLAPPTEYEKF